MQQNSKQLDGFVTCLLVQTINGIKELRLVAVQQDIIEQHKQPLTEQQQSETAPLLQNSQQQQQQIASQQQQQQQLALQQQQYQQQHYQQQQTQQQLEYQQRVQQQQAQQQLAQQQQQQYMQQQQLAQQLQQLGQQPIRYSQQQSSNILNHQTNQQQQEQQQNQQLQQQVQINEVQQELAEIDKQIDPNFNETEYHSNLVSIYNKLSCFVTFYILVNVACFVIQYTMHGSLSAAAFWIASGSVLIISMGCSCCGVRYSVCWLLTIHLLFLTVFFALEIVAFIRAIKYPILEEYVPDGDFAYNARLLQLLPSENYYDCVSLDDQYPDYYQEFRSECEFLRMIANDLQYGEEIVKPKKTYYGFVRVSEYTTVLQKAITAVYSFGLLLSIIIYYQFIKEFIHFYRYNKQIKLQKRKQELQRNLN